LTESDKAYYIEDMQLVNDITRETATAPKAMAIRGTFSQAGFYFTGFFYFGWQAN
jgi:hypothetical protein